VAHFNPNIFPSRITYSSSDSTTRQMSFPHCLHLPRRTKALPFISAVSRRIVTGPRHLLHRTLSRIFFWVNSGIFLQRRRASGVNLSSGCIASTIFLFQLRTICNNLQTQVYPLTNNIIHRISPIPKGFVSDLT